MPGITTQRKLNRYSARLMVMCVLGVTAWSAHALGQSNRPLELQPGGHICYVGNTLADRMQHHSWLETYLHAIYPVHQLTVRNLGFAADEIDHRQRSANFGSADEWLTKCQADVVFCFFGYNEALRGEAGLSEFKIKLASMLDDMSGQQYNGQRAPQIVVFSPIAHENLHSPHLPDGSENNRNLAIYTEAMQAICQAKGIHFVNLFAPTLQAYAAADTPLTMNGIHLLDHGNQFLATHIIQQLFPDATPFNLPHIETLRKAVLEKNYYWFSRYRVVDGFNVFGGRSKLHWHGQSNADVMRREMEIFDIMTANRDRKVWAAARREECTILDDNIPESLLVETNKPGPLEDGSYPYLGAEEAIDKMKLGTGMEVNVFASEEMFPSLINPVQIAVDTDSRLWVSVWPSYPHWNPTEPRSDAIVILPDEDQNGVADELIVFADELNSITGFEFWNGGLLVAAPPEIWFLRDTDGDDRADEKIRMLQGVSSADTHHSANAMLVGPDGWLYWSRGIFNVASFETPTQTYRSGISGVHRFNPRTFEVELHFPIGVNPHGDIFDQWGYQFANDGTSGTGCYINIGKGRGNKQWYPKRVRPNPAIGILSSSHFPPELQGNFLISNAIGFLGILQHEVHYDGADITAQEIEPMIVSTDPNFRPSDLEIGGDGALYVADWHNALIGHMQHNMRDPNRDNKHGRIYRITYAGRPLLNSAKMKGKPIAEVCELFFAKENSTRYRARLELTSRSATDITDQVSAFADGLDPLQVSPSRDEAQALLECLWVFEEQRLPNMALLRKVFQAAEPRVRAASIRTLGHWHGNISGWEDLLLLAAKDDSALVRAEAVKAAVDLGGEVSAEAVFIVSGQTLDPELETVLHFAREEIDLNAYVKNVISTAGNLSPTAYEYALRNSPIDDLLQMEHTEELCWAIINRQDAEEAQLGAALESLAQQTQQSPLTLLLSLIAEGPRNDRNYQGLGNLLNRQPTEPMQAAVEKLEALAIHGSSAEVRQTAYQAWIRTAGHDDVYLASLQSVAQLHDMLSAIPSLDPATREALYDRVAPFVFGLPEHLSLEHAANLQPGIRVDFYQDNPGNAALESFTDMTSQSSGIVSNISLDVPQRSTNDGYGLVFRGQLETAEPGKYTFFTTSDDGSRLYVNGELVVDNDGLHVMEEKSGSSILPAGYCEIIVTYFENGGAEGLQIAWQGPSFEKQSIPPAHLKVRAGRSLKEIAIEAIASVPGRNSDKISVLSTAIQSTEQRPAAIRALRAIPVEHWPTPAITPLVDNLIGFLSEIPARLRTSGTAAEAIELSKSLITKLPEDQTADYLEQLEHLDVRVIAMGTVPHRMIFDKEQIVVQAGQPVEFRFSNTDAMPHNFAIILPGTLAEVGELAEATGRDENALERHYIPQTDSILLASQLLQPGQTQAISFDVPDAPGVYPYVCTYPGHWRRMHGALYVVPELNKYRASPDAYLASLELPIQDELLTRNSRGRPWTFDELAAEVASLHHGRSFEVGQQLFKIASCVGCHRLNEQGRVFGPDLAKLDPQKKTTEHILRSLVEPSQEVDPKYQTFLFEMVSGKIVIGMVVEETDDEVHVVVDPLAKDKPTILAVGDIEEREPLKKSLMPEGLLNKLSREEILDLIAYIFAGGDKENPLFAEHHH